MRKSLLVLGLSALVAGALAAPAPARAMSNYYVDKSCSACHGAAPTTCNGCHHHGGRPSLSGAQASYAPGATISITISGGTQSGWIRAAILDANNAVLVKKGGSVASGAFAPANGPTYPVTVTTTAPTTPGTYTWKGAWYGNGYDSNGVIGGGSATFIPDASNGNHGYEPLPFTFTVAAPAPVTCTSFTYSAFTPSTCPSTGVQTRTVLSSSPAGCTGGNPVLSQTCTPAPVACTGFTYSAWGTCSASGTQTRTILSSTPAGCTGGSPVLTQSCTPAPVACTYTTGAWGACQSNGTQTRTVTASPAGCTGTPPATTQACTYVPPAPATCTSFTYSAFTPATCPSTGVQTRTVLTSSPAGCTGGSPVLSQSCTYVPPVVTCTAFTYSAWGTCSATGTQTRTVTSSSPAGCTGGSPVLSQSCTPPPPTTYACGTCHGIPPSSGKHGTHSGRSCSTCHGTGYSNTTVNAATHQNGTVNIATTIGWNATTRSCSNSCHGTHSWGAAGTVTVPPPPPTTTTDGAALYTADCAGCHGALASSTKKGRTAAQIQAAIDANTGGMGSLSSLTSTQVQAIATALAGTTTPPPTSTDGATLYATNCQSCHGPLATSSKRGRSATQIRNAITSNTGGMGSLSFLTSTQISAIATALADTGGTPTTSCTSCHAAPPNTGKHVFHVSEEHVSCASCHGTGYSVENKTVNATTHQDGRVQLRSSLNWSSANRSCSPGCHGTKSWSGTSSSGDDGHDGSSGDDIVVVDDGSAAPHAGGCGSTGGAFTVLVFAGLAAAILRRRMSRA